VVAKCEELIKNIRKDIRLLSNGNRPLFHIAVKSLMVLVKIFSAPMRVRDSNLKVTNMLLEFPFKMNGFEKMQFSII